MSCAPISSSITQLQTSHEHLPSQPCHLLARARQTVCRLFYRLYILLFIYLFKCMQKHFNLFDFSGANFSL